MVDTCLIMLGPKLAKKCYPRRCEENRFVKVGFDHKIQVWYFQHIGIQWIDRLKCVGIIISKRQKVELTSARVTKRNVPHLIKKLLYPLERSFKHRRM